MPWAERINLLQTAHWKLQYVLNPVDKNSIMMNILVFMHSFFILFLEPVV